MDAVMVLIYIFVFLFGITIGSFLNVCILRIPRGESIAREPSHCVACGKRLKWRELIPLFSWLALRGKCSKCGAKISVQYPLVEAANGLLWIAFYFRFGYELFTLLCCLLCSALLALSIIDARTKTIPLGFNIAIFVLAVARLLLDLPEWHLHLVGLFAISVPLLLLLLITKGSGMGGGDVWLMAACGLFLGWRLALLAFFIGCFLGSVIHLIRMRFFGADHTLALGPYLSVGVAVALLWGNDMISWYIGLL